MATRRYGRVVLLIAVVLGAPLMSRAVAQEPARQGELSRTLDPAHLSPEGKALLRAKAGEMIRSGVTEREVTSLLQQGLGRAVQPADLARLLDVVAQAKRQELPVGLVLDKIKEGLAKRVPPERIAAVASRISGELATSRDLVRRAEREGVRVEAAAERERAMEAVADALGRGVPPGQLEELSRHLARASRREATMSRLEAGAQATADLISMGLSPREAGETVGAALARGLSRRDVERLRERLAQELRRGRSPEDGAMRLREEIRTERPDDRGDRGQERDRGRDRDERGRDGAGDHKPGRR